MKHRVSSLLMTSALLLTVSLLVACATTSDDLPEVSEEGMRRVEATRADAVYVNPDADFSEFKRFAIADVDVSFRRNWLRDQNRQRVPLTHRVTQEDADRIRTAVADSFREIFTEELEKAGYTVVDHETAGTGPGDLLLLRPDILDLDVSAPDTRSPDRVRTYTACGCSMTLSLEFYDALTGTLLGRVTDSKEAPDRHYMYIANSVTNKAEADRILRRWARLLVDKLDEMNGK